LKIAFLSDLHSNGDALEAAERELASRGIDRVYHLGDLVGYNAEPEKCVRWAIRRTAGGILGNHDAVACGKAGGEFFNSPALAAARWSAEHLSAEAREYLNSLPDRLVVERELLLVHGSPSDPDRYLFTLDDAVEELDALAEEGSGVRVVFFGHTHVPAAVIRRRDGSTVSVAPREYRLGEGEIALLNPGSVGQPRDRNPESSFLVFDTQTRTASWIRTAYDIPACQRKVLAAGLPRFFATRLSEGT
jgi:predicted phosphodiesterase